MMDTVVTIDFSYSDNRVMIFLTEEDFFQVLHVWEKPDHTVEEFAKGCGHSYDRWSNLPISLYRVLITQAMDRAVEEHGDDVVPEGSPEQIRLKFLCSGLCIKIAQSTEAPVDILRIRHLGEKYATFDVQSSLTIRVELQENSSPSVTKPRLHVVVDNTINE